ncbi:MAG: hypothetical protein R3C09_09115 [Pirellulaceae bacterium]
MQESIRVFCPTSDAKFTARSQFGLFNRASAPAKVTSQLAVPIGATSGAAGAVFSISIHHAGALRG